MELGDGDVHNETMRSSLHPDGVPIRILRDELILLTLATQVTFDDLVAAVDAARWVRSDPEAPPVHPLDCRSVRTERRGSRGSARLARALELSVDGVRSRPETFLRLAAQRYDFPPPTVGHAVAFDGWVATPDLAWPELKVLVEYEGDHHRTSARQFRHDIRRFERYQDAGWSPVRATADDIFVNPMPLLVRVERRLRAAGWLPRRRWTPRSVGAFRL